MAYASRKLYKREEKYAVIEKKCLAVVWALKVFHTYLYGKRFSIEMDHKPLAWLQKAKATTSQLNRWALKVQEYDFIVLVLRTEMLMAFQEDLPVSSSQLMTNQNHE